MFDLGTIHRMNREAAVKAKQSKTLPLVLTEDMVAAFKADPYHAGFKFPHLGDHRPRGWRLMDTIFCDTSGFGSSSEPALTIMQLANRLKAGMAYATIEVGQFQAYLGEFRAPRSR